VPGFTSMAKRGAAWIAVALLLALRLAAPVNAQSSTTSLATTTPSPAATPNPGEQSLAMLLSGLSAGGASQLVISYKINGVVYVVQCNVTSGNTTNCTFTGDHGLTVTAVGSTVVKEIPAEYLAFGIITIILLLILVGMAGYAYYIWNSRQKEREMNRYEAENDDGSSQGYPQQQRGYYAVPRGQGSQLHKVINVQLTRPYIPEDIQCP
jgi:hypothetical protein